MADPPSTVPQSSAPEGTAATTNAHIPELPNEVLCSIAGFVDDAGIPNLRLAAKVFHYITAERFATVFFQDRAYELSPAGLKALVEITEHPVFAPHIRTVIIGHDSVNLTSGLGSDGLVASFQPETVSSVPEIAEFA